MSARRSVRPAGRSLSLSYATAHALSTNDAAAAPRADVFYTCRKGDFLSGGFSTNGGRLLFFRAAFLKIRNVAPNKTSVPYHKDLRFGQKSAFLKIRKSARSKNGFPYHKDFRPGQKSAFLKIRKPAPTAGSIPYGKERQDGAGKSLR